MEKIEIPTLEKLLENIQPKNVFIIIEIEEPLGAGDDDIIIGANDLVDIAVRSMSIVERVKCVLDKVTVRTKTAFKTKVPEGHATIIPTYTFVGQKPPLHDIGLSDVSFVCRLDERIQIVSVKDGDLLPYTLLAE